MLVYFEFRWLRSRDPQYHQLARFWTRVFALTFALGVSTGIVMEFEFGTNWATYSRYVGDVFGSALAAEGIFAFFLESGFLAVLLFGWDKVGPKMHFFSTCMVALGAHFSAIWIIVANSWMQTPAGFHIVGEGMKARAEITDFWAMVFNPSSVDRLLHTLGAAWMTGATLVLSVGAWYLLKKRHEVFSRTCVKAGLVAASLAMVFQLVTGDFSAKGVAKNQPAKLAAFEGLYETQARAPLYLVGWVDTKEEKTHGIAIPGMLSTLTHGDSSVPVTGLNEFKPKDRPPVGLVFLFYHGMVAVGVLLAVLFAMAFFAWWRGRLFTQRWLLWLLVPSVLGPQIANQLGWYSAEVGRQPWIVYNVLRTSDALSATVKAEAVLSSLILFTLLYLLLFSLFIYLLNDKIQHGPDEADLKPSGKQAVPFIKE
jgi:cytochrome d ubiquinol oxidase subunit I